ncbi:flagellar export protein FliJ [Salinibacterium sp. SYSU T00001]|uniref:flagellar export protein FliJ n=1 Tax=Homoserinimonas sedimenticola TaxID=2986805 RepID=UPI002235BD31|nr:flagellar export protein FliJ [Salinibacterium sedimenticola]MCW4385731.1 flagellar export protein FliJ [Salinibacterium sedimenticola]
MSDGKNFSLAGLLRLRQVQQELAAGKVSTARGRLDANAASIERARIALGASSTDITSTATLYAVAAGRASLRSTLADLEALETTLLAEVQAAAEEFGRARTSAIGLEKLEKKHAEELAAEEIKAEQDALDELTITRWHRDGEGTTP